MDVNETLSRIYYDASDPGSLGGVERLFLRAKEELPNLSRDQVKKFMTTQSTYTLHKPALNYYLRNKTIVDHIDRSGGTNLPI